MDLMLDSKIPMYTLWGPDLYFLYNDAYMEIAGERHPSAFMLPLWDAWPDAREGIEPILEKVLRGEPQFLKDLEFQLLKNGKLESRWFTFSASPIRNTDNTVAGILVVDIETTSHVLAEQRRRAESEKLRRLFEQAPSFIAVLKGPQHVYEMVNQTYLDMIGGRNVVGLPVRRALPEMEGQEFLELLDRVYASGEPFIGRGVPTRLSGNEGPLPEERYLDFVYQPIVETDGNISGIFVEGYDATEQYTSQFMLEVQKRSLELVLRGVPLEEVLTYIAQTVEQQAKDNVVVCLLLLDKNGGLHDAASSRLPAGYMAAIDGIKADPEVGTCCAAAARGAVVISPDIDNDPMWKDLKALPLAIGLRAAWGQPIIARDGRVLGTIGTYFRHARVPTQKERQVVEILAQTAALAIEHNLIEKELSVSHRRKDEFLATLAHELRNPLAPIQTGIEVLRLMGGRLSSPDTPLTMMERQISHLVRLVDDLLDISRISQGKISLRLEHVEVNDVIHKTIEAGSAAFRQNQQTLFSDVPTEPLFVKADRVRLSQIVGNLLNNAAKYTKTGGNIWVSVSVDGQDIRISVRDDGIGVAPGMLDKLFEMFMQVSSTQGGGLGIGLALVKQLVLLQGGAVEAHSEGLDLGSEFVVRLPLLNDTSPVAIPDERDGLSMLGRNVLVIDDNQDAANSLAMLLRMLGADVQTANDGPSALRALDDFAPDLILLDIGMPIMDGYETARAIRARLGTKVWLVAVTGWGQESDRERTLRAGFNQHLVKPVNLKDIEHVLECIRQ